ncbi:MAG: transposase [Planctomycetota bacterium]
MRPARIRWLDGRRTRPTISPSGAAYAPISLCGLHSSGLLNQGACPFLRDKPTRDALHAYLGGISKQLECPPIRVGGVEEHVHILARFGRTITQAEWVKELKRVSNLWLKKNITAR